MQVSIPASDLGGASTPAPLNVRAFCTCDAFPGVSSGDHEGRGERQIGRWLQQAVDLPEALRLGHLPERRSDHAGEACGEEPGTLSLR